MATLTHTSTNPYDVTVTARLASHSSLASSSSMPLQHQASPPHQHQPSSQHLHPNHTHGPPPPYSSRPSSTTPSASTPPSLISSASSTSLPVSEAEYKDAEGEGEVEKRVEAERQSKIKHYAVELSRMMGRQLVGGLRRRKSKDVHSGKEDGEVLREAIEEANRVGVGKK